MKKHPSIKETISAAVVAVILSASGTVLAGPYAMPDSPTPYLGGRVTATPSYPSGRVVQVGPCLVYQSDGQDAPLNGGAVLIKCPDNTAEFPGTETSYPMTVDTRGSWLVAGQDYVAHYGTVGTLLEYAIGQPPGFTPIIVTISTPKTVILSRKEYPCPYVGEVYQPKSAVLDGYTWEAGGHVCGPVIIKPPVQPLPVRRTGS